MKASLWALILSVFLVASAKAQQPAISPATNSLATSTPTKIAELRAKAEKADTAAQTELGQMYREGNGVPKDYVDALKWFREAAEKGNPDAQGGLGEMYAYGQGVDKDNAKAVNWYRKAAEQGNAYAQYNLGLSCFNGQGVPQDYVEAKVVQQGGGTG